MTPRRAQFLIRETRPQLVDARKLRHQEDYENEQQAIRALWLFFALLFIIGLIFVVLY